MVLITIVMSPSGCNSSGDDVVKRRELGKLEGRLKHSRQESKWAHQSRSSKNRERRHNGVSLLWKPSWPRSLTAVMDAIIKYLILACAAYLSLSYLGFF